MNEITYWRPIESAWKRMVTVLFRPFALNKWMVIGFSAFLAECGRSSGSSQVNSGGSHSGGGSGTKSGGTDDLGRSIKAELCELIDKAHDYWMLHSEVIITVGLIILLMMLLLIILVNWLNSRGQFMLLDNALKNRGAVKEPWSEYTKEADSLMVFQIVLGLISFFVILALLTGIFMPAFQMIMAERWNRESVGIMIGSVVLLIMVCLITTFIEMLLRDFVVPLMYQRRVSVIEGCRMIVPLVQVHFWKFVLYGLILMVVNTVIGFAVVLGVLVTCCTALLLLCIPYIGTVVLLPTILFRRFISIEFLKQFGVEYDLFNEDSVCSPVEPETGVPAPPPLNGQACG